MDGRQGMEMSGAASYFMHQGLGTSSWQSILQGLQGIQPFPNPNPSTLMQSSNFGGGSANSTLHGESPSSILPHMGIGTSSQVAVTAPQGEPIKKKRGRPRKYGPDGNAALSLSQHPTIGASLGSDSGPGSLTPTQKRGRGRPPGSGKKQQLAAYGECISSSAGIGFTPHILLFSVGEDVAAKIKSFSQQVPRAVCILSATGFISSVTLLKSPTGTLTFEGPYEILSLSGAYVFSENGGSHSRSGGLSVCLSGSGGYLLGGGVGKLIAAGDVQVMVGSFVDGGVRSKNKIKRISGPGAAQEPPVHDDNNKNRDSSNPQQPNQDPNPALTEWPSSSAMDTRNPLAT